MNPSLLDRLSAASEQWSNANTSSLVDSIRPIAESLAEQGHRFESSQKFLLQKRSVLTAGDPPHFPNEDYWKLIRFYRKEIETQIKRHSVTSSLLAQIRSSLATAPDVVPLFDECLELLDSVPTQLELLNALRNEIDSLRFEDSTISTLEDQIRELRFHRDQRIQKLQTDSATQMEKEKSQQIRQISDSISEIESKKREIQGKTAEMQVGITRAEEALTGLDSGDFRKGSCRRLQKRELQADLNELFKTSNSKLEDEAKLLSEQLQDAELAIAAAPPLSEWRAAQAKLGRPRGPDCESEIAKLESQVRLRTGEVGPATAATNQINVLIEQNERDLKRFVSHLEMIRGGDSAAAVVEVLKDQKQSLRDAVAGRETEIANLKREHNALESRIQALKQEKEKLVDYASSRAGETPEVRKGKLSGINDAEKIMIRFTTMVLTTPCARTTLIGYIVLLHVLVLFVFVL
jgi:cell division protein FtsB